MLSGYPRLQDALYAITSYLAPREWVEGLTYDISLTKMSDHYRVIISKRKETK